MKRKKLVWKIVYHILVTAFGLVMIYPLVWMIMSSFKETSTIFNTAGQLIPEKFVIENYINGWKGFAGVGFGTFFKNSIFISVVATIGTVFSSSIVAYGLARCRFKGKRILIVAMLLTMMLPAQVLMIPQYLWYQKLGWVNSYLPLIVPYCFAVQGFFTYLMMNFIQGIPRELDEAAKIDGCSYYGIFRRVIFPLMLPVLITSSIFSARMFFAPCSPSTHLTASTTLLFPQPFGPSSAVIPSAKEIRVLSANDLKPKISRFLRNTESSI